MTTIVTPGEVADLTGITVTVRDVAKAQFVISSTAGLELANPAFFTTLVQRDQRCLVAAVVWQCVYLSQHPEAFSGGEHTADVAAAAANGASVTFREGVDGSVAPLAQRELDNLSWRRQQVTVKTLRPYSRAAMRGPMPDQWTTIR